MPQKMRKLPGELVDQLRKRWRDATIRIETGNLNDRKQAVLSWKGTSDRRNLKVDINNTEIRGNDTENKIVLLEEYVWLCKTEEACQVDRAWWARLWKKLLSIFSFIILWGGMQLLKQVMTYWRRKETVAPDRECQIEDRSTRWRQKKNFRVVVSDRIADLQWRIRVYCAGYSVKLASWMNVYHISGQGKGCFQPTTVYYNGLMMDSRKMIGLTKLARYP